MHLLGLLFIAILCSILMIAAFFLITLLRVVGKFRSFFNPFNNKPFSQSSASSHEQQAQQQQTTFSSSARSESRTGNAHHESGSGNMASGEKIFSKDEGVYVDFEEV